MINIVVVLIFVRLMHTIMYMMYLLIKLGKIGTNCKLMAPFPFLLCSFLLSPLSLSLPIDLSPSLSLLDASVCLLVRPSTCLSVCLSVFLSVAIPSLLPSFRPSFFFPVPFSLLPSFSVLLLSLHVYLLSSTVSSFLFMDTWIYM